MYKAPKEAVIRVQEIYDYAMSGDENNPFDMYRDVFVDVIYENEAQKRLKMERVELDLFGIYFEEFELEVLLTDGIIYEVRVKQYREKNETAYFMVDEDDNYYAIEDGDNDIVYGMKRKDSIGLEKRFELFLNEI